MTESFEQEDNSISELPDAESITADADSSGQTTETTDSGQAVAVHPESGFAHYVGVCRRVNWSRVLDYGALPGLALLAAVAAFVLKWQAASVHAVEHARTESVAAAKESTIALLSYRPDTVEKVAAAAENRLTGKFRDSYTKLTRDLVIPGAKEKQVSVSVGVPAAASVAATATHAVALLYVNQSAVVGGSEPINTASSVRVTLDKIGGRWLISGFDPI